MLEKPFAPACERNKHHILQVLKTEFVNSTRVLEIGSGTGQHAVFFAKELTHLEWQTSDLKKNHSGILAWIKAEEVTNVRKPITLDVNQSFSQIPRVDAIFSANTLHIMSWPEVERMFGSIGKVLDINGIVCIYGPFNYKGLFTSESNRQFDKMLRNRDEQSGIRDFEKVDQLAQNNSLKLKHDYDMPANNRILCWQKVN